MNDVLNQIKELVVSKTAKDTYIVFVGNLISFFFGIVFAVLAARVIEPSGWGIFTAAGGMMVILFSFSELGLSSGLFKFVSGLWQEGKKKKVEEVASVILAARMVTSLIFCGLIVSFAGNISRNILRIDNFVLVYITAAGLIGSLLIDFQISLLQAKRKWVSASFLVCLTNFFRLSLFYVASYFGNFNLTVLFGVFFLSPLITFIVSLFIETPRLSFSLDSLSLIKNVSRFSLWMGLNGAVGSISSKTDSLLLIQIAGSFEAGILGAARQLSNAVIILIASFATVIATRLASYSGIHLIKYYKKTVILSLILAGGVLVGIVFVNPVISLLGPKYAPSSGVLKWLLVGLVPFALASPSVNAVIYAFHKPHVIALLSTVQLPLIILGNILLISRFGIYGPVIVLGLWNLTTLVVTKIKSRWELSAIH